MKQFKLTGNKHDDNKQLNEAASLLKAGKLVAFPTETVYGLGANALDEQAVSQIFKAKERPADNPLIVHVATVDQLNELTTDLPPYVAQLINKFSPGPITYVLNDNKTCAKNVTAGLNTIAVRLPDHPIALSLIEKSNLPIAAPSANLSGKPSPTLANHVIDDLSGKIAGIVDGGKTGVGVESTVLDCTSDTPVILRHGGITKEQLLQIVNVVDVSEVELEGNAQPKSPGMKYKHYAPEMPLILVDGTINQLQEFITSKRNDGYRIGLLAMEQTIKKLNSDEKVSLGMNETEVAQNLYRSLRTLSKQKIDYIVCESLSKQGVGTAIMDRLERAATHIVTY